MSKYESQVWPAEREEALRQCAIAGMTRQEAATSMGISLNTVIGRAHRIGVTFKPVPALVDMWPDEDEAKLRDCIQKGMNSTEASAITGKSRNACIQKSRRIGLRFGQATGQAPVEKVAAPKSKLKAPPVKSNVKAITANVSGAFRHSAPHETKAPKLDFRLTGAHAGSIPTLLVDRPRFVCTWPVEGEKSEMLFCCAPVRDKHKWCDFHREVGCTPAPAPQARTIRSLAALA